MLTEYYMITNTIDKRSMKIPTASTGKCISDFSGMMDYDIWMRNLGHIKGARG